MLKGLSELYSSLVWESTVLLALCNEDILPADSQFGLIDMEKLGQKSTKADAAVNEKKDETKTETSITGSMARGHGETGSNGVSMAMQSLTTHDKKMDVEPPDSKKKYRVVIHTQAAQIKPLLTASSRLGRSLVELFGFLVKLCVGSPVRHRRSQMNALPTPPTQQAKVIAEALTDLLTTGFRWTPPPTSPVPKLQ